jgi:hypothetical protein
MAASNDYNNQLVPHYGPNYNPYYNNYYQQQPQQPQQPPPHPYYSYSPDDVTDNGIPSVITTENTQPSVDSLLNDEYPNFGRSSNESYDDDDYIPDDVVASQARAWRDAQAPDDIAASQARAWRDTQAPDDIAASQARAWRDAQAPDDIVPSQVRAWRDAQARNEQPSTFLTATFQPTRPNVPYSRNRNGSDGVHPNRAGMKTERQITTAAAAAGGAVVGAMVTGPIFPVGFVVGGAISGYTANKIHKQGERRAQRKWEQSNFQTGAQKASIFQHKIV